MANYKIVNGKLVKINDTKKDSNTTSLINTGGDTLTIVKVDPKTGKETIVRPGISRSRSSTGLPSITPPTQEEIKKFYESQPEEKISVDEKLLKQELQKGGTQTITQGFMQLGNITGADIKLALSGLNKNPSQRTKEENQAIQKASQTSDQYRQALIQKKTQTITKTIPGETKKIITQLNQGKEKKDYFERFGRTPLRDDLSKGRNFVGSFVKIGEVGADQKEVDEQANIFISKAKDKYVKNIFSNAAKITENQKLKQEFEEQQKELDKKRQEQLEIIERNKYKLQAEQEAKEGKISGGLKLAGLEIEKLGKKVGETDLSVIPNPIDFLPGGKEIRKQRISEQFVGGFIQGVGETAKGAGNIIEAASKRKTYTDLAEAGKGTAEYFINVGKTAEIKGIKVKPGKLIPIQLDIQPGKQTKQDIETAKLLGLAAVGKAAENFAKDPFTETGKLVGSGAAIGGVTSLSGKLMGLGKAGVKIAKGGKYIDYESLYETKPQNLIKGKYKKGTPTSTIKEFKTGKNPKTLFHSTGNDFINPKTGRAKVIAPAKSPKTDPKALFGSTGSANETYLRISGESYNLKPRIPFVNMPSKIKPTTYRLVGTTTPRKLTTLGKVKNLKQGKKLFEAATTSKNIPYTSPANTLGIKAENEALLRPGTVLSKKGLKGTHDFTFVKGVFVETPRVRVMPSKPKINIGRPARPSVIKKPAIRTTRQVSFSSSINQARSPGTFYNPLSLLKSSSPSRVSSKVSFSPKPSSSYKSISSKIISPSTSPSISPSPSPRPSPSRNPFRSSSSTNKSSSNSFISSRSSFSSSTSTIKSSSKPPIYKPSLLYKPTKYDKIAPRKKYGLKNIIKFNSFGKAKDSKVRFI